VVVIGTDHWFRRVDHRAGCNELFSWYSTGRDEQSFMPTNENAAPLFATGTGKLNPSRCECPVVTHKRRNNQMRKATLTAFGGGTGESRLSGTAAPRRSRSTRMRRAGASLSALQPSSASLPAEFLALTDLLLNIDRERSNGNKKA